MSAPSTFTQWLLGLPIPWLTGGTHGQAEARAWGGYTDEVIAKLKSAAKCSLITAAPSDAVPHIGSERGIIQGAGESDDAYRARVAKAWETWGIAGTAYAVLLGLRFLDGTAPATSNAVITNNGIIYTLDGSDGLVITDAGINPAMSGSPPWWTMDDVTDFGSRFVVILSYDPASIDADRINRVRQEINRWKAARATCMQIIALTSGRVWGYPKTTWGHAGVKWQTSSNLVYYSP